MRFIYQYDILSKLQYEVNDNLYRGDIYLKAYESANRDPRLKKDIEKLEEDYIEKWCKYYMYEENQKG